MTLSPASITHPLRPAAVAVLLTIAFHYSYLEALPSIPVALRMATHASLVPLLALLILRRPLPHMAFSPGCYRMAAIAFVFVLMTMLIAAVVSG